ncbi:MAG: hypothetical protein AB1486_30280 [Planctomycetota bacterium]
MKIPCLILAWLAAVTSQLLAQPQCTLNETHTDGTLESAWVVQIPAGSSDFFNQCYEGCAGRPITGVTLGSADFGAATGYPMAGLFDANFTLDPAGNTPDLASGRSTGPIPGGGGVFHWVYAPFDATYVPVNEPQHVVVQFPPGDPGLLAIGADTSEPAEVFNGWSFDGYQTPANGFDFDFALNLNIDVIAELQGQNDGCLRLTNGSDEMTGDFTELTVQAGDPLGFVFFAGSPGTLWLLFLSVNGVPWIRVSPILPTIPCRGGGYFRLAGIRWPFGFGGAAFSLVAVSGRPGVPGGVGISNEVQINVLPDPPDRWGALDDGTYESGWVVAIPGGSSDFFNVNFNAPGLVVPDTIEDLRVAVLDFGTAATSFPLSGVFPANYTVDPSGDTPDLTLPYEAAPFPINGGEWATTSAQMSVRTFSPAIPYWTLISDDVHGVIQFPPADPGLIAIGADTVSTHFWGNSGSSFDGYTTPANRFTFGNWGIRLGKSGP